MTPRSFLLSLLATAVLAACGGGTTSDTDGAAGQTSALTEETASITATTLPTAETTTQIPLDRVAAQDLRARMRSAAEINGSELDGLAKLAGSGKTSASVGTGATSERAVYRFWRPKQGTHFYTASSTERDQIIAGLPDFRLEGVAFVAHTNSAMGLLPVYRFLNTVSGSHFYTASESEKRFVQTHIPELRLEGVAYYAATQASNGFVPTFRFFNATKLTHFYTRSEEERDQLIAAGGGYTYEGVAYYVLPSRDTSAPVLAEVFPAAGESVPTTVAYVSGKVGDNVAVKSLSLKIGATEVPATLQAGAFSASLPLVAGLNSYTIVAEDYAGNRLESPATVYLGSRAAGGGSHSGAIRNGLLYTVGRNNTGQLGFGNTSVLADGEAAHPTLMRQIGHGAQTPVSLAFNQNFSLMLDSVGTVWSWGSNASGQLGLGTCGETMVTDNQLVPAHVTGLSSVQTIAAGYDHSLALKADGTVWAFGKNNVGQLGDGSTTDRDCAVQVRGLPTDAAVIQVAAGSQGSYALDAKGRVWAWGRNQYGNLGQGTTSSSSAAQSAPVRVLLDAKIVMLATGRDHVLALTESGAVVGWGLNASSQLTGEWGSPVALPAMLPALPDASALRVWANGNSSWVMKEVGVPYRWGQRLGNSGTDFPSAKLPAPERVSASLTDVLDVGPGASHWLVLKATGRFVSLGWSFQASLGSGPSTIDTWAYVEPISVVFP